MNQAQQPAQSFYPAWSLRTDAAEADRLQQLCLHPASAFSAHPAPVGTAAWWAAVEAGTLPLRVHEGRIARGTGRPGYADPLVWLLEADGTESVHPAHPAPWAPWGLAGKQARITVVGHPAKPGRSDPVCWVQILFELSAKPKRRQAKKPRGKPAKRAPQPVQAEHRDVRASQAERQSFYHLDDPLLRRAPRQPAGSTWMASMPRSKLGLGFCGAYAVASILAVVGSMLVSDPEATFALLQLPLVPVLGLLIAAGLERNAEYIPWLAAYAAFVPVTLAALYAAGWAIGRVLSDKDVRRTRPPR